MDGPPGPTVTLSLDLGFNPDAAGRSFDVLVLATDDAGDFEGFAPAGTVMVQAAEQ